MTKYIPNVCTVDRSDRIRCKGPRNIPVKTTILYRHPLRSDEAGVAIIPDLENLAAMKDRLEDRGYMVIEIVSGTVAEPMPSS